MVDPRIRIDIWPGSAAMTAARMRVVPPFRHFSYSNAWREDVTGLDGLVWWWRTLDWWGVRRARLWQSVVCVGVVAAMGVILGLLMWSL